jgi:hypothetical protein
MRCEPRRMHLRGVRVTASLCFAVGTCLACSAGSQQPANVEASRSYNASANRSYVATMPELYVPSREPLIEAAAKASSSRGDSLSANTLRTRQQLDQRSRPAANVLTLRAQRPSGTYTAFGSSPHSAVYSAALNQRKSISTTRRPLALPSAPPAYSTFRTTQPKSTLAQPHATSLDEPSFGKRKDKPSSATAWNSTTAH